MPNTILETLDGIDAQQKITTKGEWDTEYNSIFSEGHEIAHCSQEVDYDDRAGRKNSDFIVALHNSYATISDTLRRALAVVEEMGKTVPAITRNTIDDTGFIEARDFADWRTAILRKHGFGE